MDLLKNIFKGDKVIWIIFLVLCIISVIEVFSASSMLVYKSGNHLDPIARHSTFLIIGTLFVILFHNISYKWFQVFPWILLPTSGVFLLLLLLFDNLNLGGILVIEKVNEAGRWVKFLGIQFQPSEFAKMAVIIVTAGILSRGQTEEGANPKAFKRILLIAGGMCAFILPENYSTGVLLFFTVYLMMFIGQIAWKKLLLLTGTLATVVILFVSFLFLTPNQVLEQVPMGHRWTTVKARIARFVDPTEVPPAKYDIDQNAQIAHANIAIATSHIIGKGPGNSVQRDFLSQAFSDFIFAIIIEEMGLIGGIVVVFLYVCLLIRVGRIAQKCDRTFPAFLIIGIALLLVTQALFNMMVAVGMVPVTGQPLPLISRGGTSTIINCMYIGMILSVSRYTSKLDEQREHDAQIPLQVEVGAADEIVAKEAQPTSEPTSRILNDDSEFE